MSSTLCKSVGVIFPPGMLPDCCQTLWLNHWERACLVLKQQISSEYTGFTKCWFGSSLVVQWIRLHVSTEGGVRLIPWSGTIPQTVAKNKKKNGLVPNQINIHESGKGCQSHTLMGMMRR